MNFISRLLLFITLLLPVWFIFFRDVDPNPPKEVPKTAEAGHEGEKKEGEHATAAGEQKLSLANLPPVSGEPATLKGSIKFSGKAKIELIKMNADAVCEKQNAGKSVPQNTLVVNPNGTLANAFIYIKEGAKKVEGDIPGPVEIDQKGCMYHPHVIGVRVGQPLSIVNNDPTMHNVNAASKQGQGFNMGMPQQGQTIQKTFSKPEVMIRMKCDVHAWMYSYIGVMEHPYFAVSDTNGNFEIPKLPAGHYIVEAWHEKLGAKVLQVSMSGKEQSIEFTF